MFNCLLLKNYQEEYTMG